MFETKVTFFKKNLFSHCGGRRQFIFIEDHMFDRYLAFKVIVVGTGIGSLLGSLLTWTRV